MYKAKTYLILLLLLACSRTPRYKKWEVGNWSTYQREGDTVLYTIKDTEDGERFWLEVAGNGYCIMALVNNGTIDSVVGYDGNLIDVNCLSFNTFEPSTQTKDTIVGDKRIVIQQLNDTLWVSPQVPIFGIVSCGNIHLLDFGYNLKTRWTKINTD